MIEGTGKGYHNSNIDVPVFGSCFTYLASASHICNELTTYDWYKEMVLLGCRKHRLCERYTAFVEATKIGPDPDERRSGEQWQIVERLRNDM